MSVPNSVINRTVIEKLLLVFNNRKFVKCENHWQINRDMLKCLHISFKEIEVHVFICK